MKVRLRIHGNVYSGFKSTAIALVAATATTATSQDLLLPKISNPTTELKEIPAPFHCSDRELIRKKVKARNLVTPQNALLEWKKGQSHNFIFVDPSKRMLIVCVSGKTVAAQIPGKNEEGQNFELEPSALLDLNKDGKQEFIVWDAQCVEGPCMGSRTLIRIDSGKLVSIATIEASVVDVVQVKGSTLLKLITQCFTREFGDSFKYFDIAEMNTAGRLSLVPYREIARRFPELLPKRRGTHGADKTASRIERASAEIQALIDKAYHGESLSTLQSEYKRIAAPFGSDGPPIDCDVPRILTEISNKKS